jgi:hypothetical protein
LGRRRQAELFLEPAGDDGVKLSKCGVHVRILAPDWAGGWREGCVTR